MRRLFIGFSLFLCLSSCKVIEPSVPENFVEPYPELNKEVSSVTIPVEMDLSAYFMAAEKEIPTTYSGVNEQCEGVSTSYTFKRENILFTGHGNKIGYDVQGQLKLNINYCPKCHTLIHKQGDCIVPRMYMSCGVNEPMRRFALNYSTTVKVNTDYSFNTNTNLQKFELLDPCELTIANIDVTSHVEDEITKQLKKLEDEIDKQFRGIDIKTIARDSWKFLQEPTEIENYGYLTLSPSSLAMSDIKFNGKKANFNFNIDVSPSFTTEKPHTIAVSLPELSSSKEAKGLSFSLDAILSYDSLSSFIRSSFIGQTYQVKRKKIIIDDIAVSGSKDNRIILKTQFSGSKKGIIYLLATPVLNDSLKQIEFENVDFDVESKSILLKSAKWFFNSRINQMIEENAVYKYTEMMNDLKSEINHSLNQEITKGVNMKGEISEITINQIYYTATHFVLRTHLRGHLKLILD